MAEGVRFDPERVRELLEVPEGPPENVWSSALAGVTTSSVRSRPTAWRSSTADSEVNDVD